jgi:acyl carrier protein
LEPAALSLLESRIEAYARRWLREVMKVEPPADAVDEPFAALGLDSIMRVRLFQAIEKHFDTVIPDATAHGLESIRELARFACYPPSAERAVPAERSESTASEQTRSDIVFPSFTASSPEPRR